MDVSLLSFYALCLALLPGTQIKGLHIIENSSSIEDTDNQITHHEGKNISIQSVPTFNKPITTEKSASSSEESNSNEHDKFKGTESSKSKESSSSEEKQHAKITKRSLDSKQDPINIIGDHVNHSSAVKENTEYNKDVNFGGVTTVGSVDESSIADVIIDPLTTPSTTEETTFGDTTLAEAESQTSFTGTESEIKVTEAEPELGITTTEKDLETETTESESGSTLSESEFENDYNGTTTEVQNETTVKEETTESVETESSTTEEKFISEENDDVSLNSTADQSISSKENSSDSFIDATTIRVYKLSDQIRQVLMQYRNVGAVVIPGLNIFPEPMKLQNLKQSFSIGTVDMKNMSAYGLSNFTIEHINTDVDRMQVYIALKMKKILILGNYTLKTFWSRAAGPFNVTLLDVDSEGVAEIETTSDGHLEATDSNMDMFTKNMLVDFKNMGFMGSMFQGAVGAVGDAIFDSIKPQILERVNLIIRSDVNKKLKDFSVKFVNKISPVQLAFSEGRKYVREHGYDPYNIGDHSFVIGGLMHINITDFWVEGLSKFYRVGNLSISMDEGIIEVGVHAITQKLHGRCKWSGETFGISKSGKTNFTVDHLQVRALVKQSLDIRKKPQLDKLDLELGWVKVTMESQLSLNMMIEGIINAFPRLIRHIIVDTLEQPLKEKIQEILDQINVESVVNENLPRLDSFGL